MAFREIEYYIWDDFLTGYDDGFDITRNTLRLDAKPKKKLVNPNFVVSIEEARGLVAVVINDGTSGMPVFVNMPLSAAKNLFES